MHPYCAQFFASLAREHERVQVQNVRDFPQTKLDNEINFPFFLNEHGDPNFFFQVFAKNSVIKNIFKEEEKFDSRTRLFFLENVLNWMYFDQGEDFKLTRNCLKTCSTPATKQTKTA